MNMSRIWEAALLIGICMIASQTAWSQSADLEREVPTRFGVAFTYNPVLANVTLGNEFGLQGGSAQVQARLWRRLCLVADVAGLHTSNVNGSGVGLDLITATFGPRYVWSPHHRHLILFGEALAGEAYGLNSVFPSSTGTNSTGNSIALQIGGGLNLPLTHHFSIRAFDADWLRTQLPNATTNVQNNLRLGVGLAYAIR
jgi:hypothetical protein